MIVKAFLGSNTPQGFCGYFDNMFSVAKTVILKGSPGSGKSTLLRKLGARAEDGGFDIEYYYCSGDVNSLDGIYIPKLSYAILDGTSPHALDAQQPLLNEVVVNLTERANTAQITPYAEELKTLMSNKKGCFSRAYAYLKAASCILMEIHGEQLKLARKAAITAVTDDVWQLLRAQPSLTDRKLFLRAITAAGVFDYTAEFSKEHTLICLNGPEAVSLEIIGSLSAKLDDYDIAHSKFCNPFLPQQAEGLLVGEYFITTHSIANAPYIYNVAAEPLNNTLQLSFDALLNCACNALADAKSIHLEIEKYYVPSMDFDDINKKTAIIADMIFASV